MIRYKLVAYQRRYKLVKKTIS